ncbi:hypothetical protein HBN50_15620 [Halobacteriovorax sp. GB3]|uniref:hypothetical protein n=1 Tax=Halobacteriovorax sp. GB3 TaxID=2719615 RepID=UPI0023616B13|nr:hypothetical protein [Halobacteriovorax sp. GB3]MDD0854540.1 hypothetical protein [Halobacteriovorax sp. GB3]
MKKLVKGLAIVALLLAVIISGGIFYASKKLNPEKIRSLTIEQIQNAFPKAKVSLGKVDYSLGLKIKIHFNFLEISLPKNQKVIPMTNIKDFKAELPLIGFLFGKNEAEIIIDSPKLYYSMIGKKSNWEFALGSKKKVDSKVTSKESSKTKIENKESSENNSDDSAMISAGPLAGLSLNISIQNALVSYDDGTSLSKVSIDKVLVRDLSLLKKSSFEIKTHIEKEKLAKLNALVIGEFELKDLLENKKIESYLNIKLSDISLENFGSFPNVKAETKVQISESIEASVKTLIGESSHINFIAKIDKNKVNVDRIDTDLHIMGLLDGFGDIKKSLDAVKIVNTKLKVTGNVALINGKIIPNLSGHVGPEIKVSASGIDTSTEVDFGVKGNNISSSTTTKTLDGVVTTKLDGDVDINNFDLSKLKPFNALVTINGINYQKKFVLPKEQKETPTKNQNRAKTDSVKKEQAKDQSVPLIPPMNLEINLKNNKIADAKVNGDLKITLGKSGLKILKKSYLNIGDGRVDLNSNIALSEKISGDFSVNLKKLNFDLFSRLLPDNTIEKLQGVVSADTNGTFSIGKALVYSSNIVFNGTNVGISGVDFGKHATEYIRGIPSISKYVKKDFSYKAGSKLESLSFKGRVTNELITMNNYALVLDKKMAKASGSGKISMLNQDSVVYVDFVDNTGKISKPLKKELGMNSLPLKLIGKGFSLTPDYEYTIKKSTKSAVKTQGKKVIQKELNKLLKGKNKKKVDKLLKGLFN